MPDENPLPDHVSNYIDDLYADDGRKVGWPPPTWRVAAVAGALGFLIGFLAALT